MASLLYSLLRWCCLTEQYSRRAEYVKGHCSVNELDLIELPFISYRVLSGRATEPGWRQARYGENFRIVGKTKVRICYREKAEALPVLAFIMVQS
jgi:hypothetical protein